MDPWETQHRAVLLRRTGGVCAFCGAGISRSFGSGWTVARWLDAGGLVGADSSSADVPGNLWPVCAHCADDKGDLDGRQYVALRLECGRPVNPRWQAYAKIAASVVGSDRTGTGTAGGRRAG